MSLPTPSQRDFEILAQFRQGLRGFLGWSERVTAAVGSTHAIHQLLLVLQSRRGEPVDITVAASTLSLRHHSAAELVKRAEELGLVQRESDPADRRRSLLTLTDRGAAVCADVAAMHIRYLRGIYEETFAILGRLGQSEDSAAGR